MKKVLVETTGEFQLVDFSHTHQIASAHRPSVVVMTDFMRARLGLGQLTVHGTVTDEATDDEFAKYWVECENPELAVESFLAAFMPDEGTKKAVAEKPAGKRAAKKDAE